MLLFALMLGLAAANRFFFSPRLESAVLEGNHVHDVRILRRSLRVEACLGCLVLGLVAWLGMLSPQSWLTWLGACDSRDGRDLRGPQHHTKTFGQGVGDSHEVFRGETRQPSCPTPHRPRHLPRPIGRDGAAARVDHVYSAGRASSWQ
ncbi:CopD family protein [Ramlibacter aquaticus]|uniref:CopD family protein n=1 Tax=Ramlibacter aquaticus TaxID=2780094 RepID=A0ABR9SES1_9BURK|nr:CopD family protein [Ramlibacter aquaticus]